MVYFSIVQTWYGTFLQQVSCTMVQTW